LSKSLNHEDLKDESNREPAELEQPEVRQHLRFVDRQDSVDGLQLQQQPGIHDKVEAIAAVERDAFVLDRQR